MDGEEGEMSAATEKRGRLDGRLGGWSSSRSTGGPEGRSRGRSGSRLLDGHRRRPLDRLPVGRRVGLAGDDRGSAVVEFVTLGVLLVVPLVYLVLAMGRVQAATYAADGSARAAARAFVLAPTEDEATDRARAAVRLGLRDQGFDVDDAGALHVSCSLRPCLTPGGEVVATVTVDVVLPGVPAGVDGVVPVHVTVRSAQVAVVDEFRAEPP
jgi:hypothetical protein